MMNVVMIDRVSFRIVRENAVPSRLIVYKWTIADRRRESLEPRSLAYKWLPVGGEHHRSPSRSAVRDYRL